MRNGLVWLEIENNVRLLYTEKRPSVSRLIKGEIFLCRRYKIAFREENISVGIILLSDNSCNNFSLAGQNSSYGYIYIYIHNISLIHKDCLHLCISSIIYGKMFLIRSLLTVRRRTGFYFLYLHVRKFPQLQNIRNKILDLIGLCGYNHVKLGSLPAPQSSYKTVWLIYSLFLILTYTSPLNIS